MTKKYSFFLLILAFILTGNIQSQNLLPHWDANGLGLNQTSIANTEMWRWGWYCTNNGYNLGTANIGAGNIRFCDAQTVLKATKNGVNYTGRFAQLRWDDSKGSGNASAYTVLGYGDGTATTAAIPTAIQLTENTQYNFSFRKYAEGSIYVKMDVTSDPTGTDPSKVIATMDINEESATKDIKFLNFDFTCPTSGGYYLIFKFVSGSVKLIYLTDIDLHVATIPTIQSATNVTQNEFTANWSAIAGAGAYQLDVATDNTFTNFVSGYNSKSITGTSETITGLTPGTIYFYRVRSVKESVASENSAIISVTTVAAATPNAPSVNDVKNIDLQGFTMNWNAVPGAHSYLLDVATDPLFTKILPQYNNYNVTGTSINITGLNPNNTYYCRVRTFNGSLSEYSNVITAKTQKLLIVLLAGQSNMAGRGIYSELAPADTVTYSNILSLNKDSVWVRAKHPLHWDKSEAAVGMGIAFAKKLADQMGGDVAIGLVPCAAGGTNLDAWINNDFFAYTLNVNLYSNLITRANKAKQSGDIIGMIWHQGEANAGSADYTGYQTKLKNFFVKVRTDLNIPDMPIVAGELGRYASYTYLNEINTVINELTNSLPNYGVASSLGLTPNSDNVHFTANSQITLGKRYADVFYSIYNNSFASITSLVLNAGTLTPVFNPEITNYTCYIPAGVNSVTPSITYLGAKASGAETVDVSSGTGVSTITVTAFDKTTTKIYTINFRQSNDVDYTNLIVNNDFDLAPDPTDCSKSVPVASGIDGWVSDAWRPKEAVCKQIYGWTCDLDLGNLGNNSQGINVNTGGTKHGDWACWIAGNYQLPKELHEFYQIIDKAALPAGTYKLQCMLGVQHTKITTQRIFANNNVQYHGSENQYVSNLTVGELNTFAGYPSGENNLREMVVYTTIGENDSLKIGIRTGNKKSDGTTAGVASGFWGWFKTDYFRLTKIDPVIATDATLAAITLSVGSLNFSPETTIYDVVLPKGTETVTANATVNMQGATITGTGPVDVSSGSGISTIVVTAMDGVTKKTYTINYMDKLPNSISEAKIKKATYSITNRRLTVEGVDSYTVYAISGMKIADVKSNINTAIELNPGIFIVKTREAETFKLIVK